MASADKTRDVIIIGGGPAGLSAALLLARSRRSVLIIDDSNQRNLKSHGLHNFLTRDGILPPDFLHLSHQDLKQYPVTYRQAKVIDIKAAGKHTGFILKDSTGANFSCRRVLMATGVTDNIPDVPGMKELWGSSVFHCPFCDGYECTERTIGLYAQKHNGYGMALALCHLSKHVILFTDGSHYLNPAQRSYLAKRKIKVYTRRISHLNYTDCKLDSVEMENGAVIPCDSMFTHHGHRVNNELILKLGCKCTKKGAIITNKKQQTNIPGVYVAGDASYDMHFVVVAASEGVKAAVAIHNDLLQADNAEELSVND